MASRIQFKRKIGGTGSPGATGALEGEIAFAFPTTSTTPEMWAFGNGAWERVNPPGVAPTVATPSLTGGTPGSKTGIGAAWTALNPKPTDPIIIATFAGGAYLKKAGAGGTDGDWTSLGSATQFAVAADIITGTDAGKALNSVALRGATLNTPSGGTDTDKLIRLNANNVIDPGFRPVSIQAEDITSTAGANIGAAWGASGKTITGDVVMVSWGTPAKTYVLNNKAAATAVGSWTVVGGAIPFATPAEIKAGTVTNKAIDPKNLADPAVSIAAPTGGTASNTDANKLLRLDPNGKVLAAFLPAMPSEVRGAVDPTKAFAQPATGGNYKGGDIVFANNATPGPIGTGWTGLTGSFTGNVSSGDALIFDGTNWHILPNDTDLNAYLKLSGGNMAAGSTVTFAVPTTAGLVTRLDGTDPAKSRIDNFSIDLGTY